MSYETKVSNIHTNNQYPFSDADGVMSGSLKMLIFTPSSELTRKCEDGVKLFICENLSCL